ncbi:hypothetical protein BKA70DRAFT_1505420 [Coprinopsis sp. MPI-PUGE-AT-0042]|nr:hypothetical protein BKA70DRAFT_1505420 [Coprinopsis sp. MPI-PUGE-AT-0042]
MASVLYITPDLPRCSPNGGPFLNPPPLFCILIAPLLSNTPSAYSLVTRSEYNRYPLRNFHSSSDPLEFLFASGFKTDPGTRVPANRPLVPPDRVSFQPSSPCIRRLRQIMAFEEMPRCNVDRRLTLTLWHTPWPSDTGHPQTRPRALTKRRALTMGCLGTSASRRLFLSAFFLISWSSDRDLSPFTGSVEGRSVKETRSSELMRSSARPTSRMLIPLR